MPVLDRIEIVADNSKGADATTGFLRLRRLTIQNHYEDGTTSAPYDCDIVSRIYPDAVAVIVYDVETQAGDRRAVRVAMRTGVRPPVYLRKTQANLARPETRDLRLLTEIVAGVLEPEDTDEQGIDRRAAAECAEEVGYVVPLSDIHPLGASMYPSPGVTDEQVYYRHARTDLDARNAPGGDGSVMEEAGEVVFLTLDEAVHRCRAGTLPDTKSEIALLRLCDAIGYNLQLGCFVDTLPDTLRPTPARLAWLMGCDESGAGSTHE